MDRKTTRAGGILIHAPYGIGSANQNSGSEEKLRISPLCIKSIFVVCIMYLTEVLSLPKLYLQ